MIVRLIDAVLGLRSRFCGDVAVGHGTTLQWRYIRGTAGNRLRVGTNSIIHANITFEARGGEIGIGDRTYIGRSNLICYRGVSVGNDVIMSWGITIVDHDSHSLDWGHRQNDVRDWESGRKSWDHVAKAPVRIADKVWIGFNVSILKGVSIGEGAVVGAGSVVVHDIPPYSLAVGNPAKVVRSLVSEKRS
jgi:acetyltransferase-like isoleucine patch superfamily enzyme